MKRIGLCIVYNINNYGSMLQAFVTVRIMQGFDLEPKIIRYKKSFMYYLTAVTRLFNRITIMGILENLKKALDLCLHKEFRENIRIRNERFRSFCDNRFGNHFSPVCNGYKELCKHSSDYDIILSGSDQLWLPSGLATNFYNMVFVPDTIPKMSYASSFGVSKIPFYQKKRTAGYLNRIEHISVREIAGQKIINELTGRDVPLVCDPTLLLTGSEWEKEIPPKRMFDKPYIFTYFLGAGKGHREAVNELKKKTNIPVITLRHLERYIVNDEDFGDYAPYDIGPEEFVNLIRFADFVCTDSFHGTVFSILNHRSFLTFNRFSSDAVTSRNSRIDSICQVFGLENRRFNGDIDKINDDIDWNAVEIKVQDLREKSFCYLKKALQCEI